MADVFTAGAAGVLAAGEAGEGVAAEGVAAEGVAAAGVVEDPRAAEVSALPAAALWPLALRLP
ncbi:MAG: hypothetical protein ACXVSE_15070 [Solirubrobacteraceae bacterium]